MELRLNVVFLTLMALAVLGMTSTDPVAAFDPRAISARRLAELEDAEARAPDSVTALVDLLSAYLDERRYELASAAVHRARPTVAGSPEAQHRLARAEEGQRHFAAAHDAAVRADLRCAASAACPAHRRAIFALHRTALARLSSMPAPTDEQVAAAYATALNTRTLRSPP